MSELILHSKEFLSALSRCSVGNTFEYFQMLVSKDLVKSGTTNSNQSLVSILNFKNDFLEGLSDSDIFEFNFINSATTISPQIKLFSENTLKTTLSFSKGVIVSNIKVKEKTTKTTASWALGVPNSSLVFSSDSKLKAFTPFSEIKIDDAFINTVESIKKATSTSKVYFTTSDNSIKIEATDYKNDFSGNFNRVIEEKELDPKYQDLIMCFDAPMFFAVLKQIDPEKDFNLKIIYKSDKKIAAILLSCADNSELYFMPSIIEEYNDKSKVIKRMRDC